jgi:hypothetical protein
MYRSEKQVEHSLSTRDTSNEIVTDNRVDSVRNTKDRHDDVSQVLGELRLGQSSRRCTGSSGLGSEAVRQCYLALLVSVSSRERVSNSKLREVDINLSGVDRLSSELR